MKEGVIIKWGIARQERVCRWQSPGRDRLGDRQMVVQVPSFDPALTTFGGRADGQGRGQKQQCRDDDREDRGWSRSAGGRDGEAWTERAEDKQSRCGPGQHAEHVKPVEGKDLTGQAESERGDRQRGGNAVEDIRQRAESGRGSEAQQEAIAGKKQPENRAGHRAGHRPRKQRKNHGDGEKGQTARRWTYVPRQGPPPSPGGAAESVRGTKR